MIKDRYYCIYHGKEYKINRHMYDNKIYIYTKNKDIIDKSFHIMKIQNDYICIYDKNYYEKEIQYGEVDEAYDIRPWAAYGNMREPIENETEDRYIIYTSETDDEEVIERYHLKWIDRGKMGGWISKGQAELKYFRRDIDYFGDWKRKLGRESEGYGETCEITLDEE